MMNKTFFVHFTLVFILSRKGNKKFLLSPEKMFLKEIIILHFSIAEVMRHFSDIVILQLLYKK